MKTNIYSTIDDQLVPTSGPMFFAKFCDMFGGCRLFGPFRNSLTAKDWIVECQELGYFPESASQILEVEDPAELGFGIKL